MPAGADDEPPATKIISAPTPEGKPKIRSVPRTPQLNSLLKGGQKQEGNTSADPGEDALAEPFTEEQLREAWNTFAERRRKFQAEYHLLTLPYKLEGTTIVVDLLSPLQETMLTNMKLELTSFLREQLRNNTIQVTGQVREEQDQRVIYTNREKFDFLAQKNPMLNELKERLGLDTDF